ncbi:MAG: dTDP-4-dehydrorhamnose 3,5-epimerase [Anaerolineaceae bacterium]|nr:dTDP-4-dehydrorhamnose 3,5-epimerase [Anaerolineaceae bacterium]
MKFITTSIPDVILIEPQVFGDERGFFMETYHQEKFSAAGINYNFVQDNHSRSTYGTLRGIHYQIRHTQGKLVRAIAGEIFDVAVDLRRSSPTFGKWAAARLSAENKSLLWVPPGFGHAFYTLSDWAEVIYKATDFYSPADERSIIWNDALIGIQWPENIQDKLLLSQKDAQGVSLSDAEVYP